MIKYFRLSDTWENALFALLIFLLEVMVNKHRSETATQIGEIQNEGFERLMKGEDDNIQKVVNMNHLHEPRRNELS